MAKEDEAKMQRLMIKGMISEMSEEDQKVFKDIYERLLIMFKGTGNAGAAAFALFGVEVSSMSEAENIFNPKG